MPNFAQVTLIGHLGRKPESKTQAAQAPSGGGPADYDDEIPF